MIFDPKVDPLIRDKIPDWIVHGSWQLGWWTEGYRFLGEIVRTGNTIIPIQSRELREWRKKKAKK